MSIRVSNISKTYHQFKALNDVSLTINHGELVALLGPSGCGKTTLLRIIAGLENPDPGSGPIYLHDDDVTHQQAGHRKIGFVFQHYSLFRHMTIFDNVAFGLNVRPKSIRPSKKEIHDKVYELLNLIQLERVAAMYPHQLSGGQRQRIALIRALAVEPNILLLDEPFGALDAKVRKDLRKWLRRLHERMSITSVFVTHDQDEAMEVSNRIVVMNQGIIEQIGTPEEVYEHPANPFVYNFLGDVNLFHGRIHDGKIRVGQGEYASITTDDEAKPVVAYVRPHDIEISHQPDDQFNIPASILHIVTAGAIVRIELKRQDKDETLEAELSKERYHQLNLHINDTVYLHIKKSAYFGE